MKKVVKGVAYVTAWALIIVHEVAAMTQVFDWIDELFKPKKIDAEEYLEDLME